MATLPGEDWSNASDTGGKTCPCGTWKSHWLNHSGEPWPSTCLVVGCTESPTLGAHVKHRDVSGTRIAPLCDACNRRTGTFTLYGTLTNANTNA